MPRPCAAIQSGSVSFISEQNIVVMMKSVRLTGEGGPEKLVLADVERPVPGPGEVLVRVHCASVNAVDRRVREGYLADWIPRPYTAGSDFSGVIEAAGAGADLLPGSRVFGGIAPNTGAYAEYLVFPASALALIPDAVSFAEAAALPVAGLTAHAAIMDVVALNPGDRVLVQGAAGGVGHFAVQMAKGRGAYVLATASADDLDFVRSLGADEVFDYRKAYATGLRDLALVVDGRAESMQKVYHAMKPGAHLVSLFDEPISPPSSIHVSRVNTQYSRALLDALVDDVRTSRLRVNVSREFPLADAGIAEDSARRGKVVVRVSHS